MPSAAMHYDALSQMQAWQAWASTVSMLAHLATTALAALHMGSRLPFATLHLAHTTGQRQSQAAGSGIRAQGSGIRDQGRGHVCGMCGMWK